MPQGYTAKVDAIQGYRCVQACTIPGVLRSFQNEAVSDLQSTAAPPAD
jgi:hypothetical protein